MPRILAAVTVVWAVSHRVGVTRILATVEAITLILVRAGASWLKSLARLLIVRTLASHSRRVFVILLLWILMLSLPWNPHIRASLPLSAMPSILALVSSSRLGRLIVAGYLVIGILRT